MELKYQENWEIIKKRMLLWWDNEILDRPMVAVTAPLDEKNPFVVKKPETQEGLKEFYTNPEWILERSLQSMERTYFGGDALPVIFPYMGTGGHAKYISPKVLYHPDTIWIEQAFDDYEKFDFTFDRENAVFQAEKAALKYLSEAGKGKFLVGMPDNCGSYDALSQLRGGQEFIMDLLDEPELVRRSGNKMVDILIESGNELMDVMWEGNDNGSVQSWMNAWYPGKIMQMQCDLSVMISPKLYEEFIVEELTRTSSWLDRSIYHLDGIEQTRFLDLLLAIPTLDKIQWTQVDGQPWFPNNFEYLHKILKAGKGLVIQPYKRQLNAIVNEIPLEGVMTIVLDAANKQEADEIVDFVAKHSFKKKLY